jgi:hypothetical protein
MEPGLRLIPLAAWRPAARHVSVRVGSRRHRATVVRLTGLRLGKHSALAPLSEVRNFQPRVRGYRFAHPPANVCQPFGLGGGERIIGSVYLR